MNIDDFSFTDAEQNYRANGEAQRAAFVRLNAIWRQILTCEAKGFELYFEGLLLTSTTPDFMVIEFIAQLSMVYTFWDARRRTLARLLTKYTEQPTIHIMLHQPQICLVCAERFRHRLCEVR